MNKLPPIIISFVLLMLTPGMATANPLFSLENLERERAALLQILTSQQLSVEQRYQKADSVVRRLVDIERMVLRDDRLANSTNSNNVMVKRAFAHYELTFLIHAGAEAKKSPIVHWLTELNFTTANILTARAGNR